MDDRDDWGSILARALVRFKNLLWQYNRSNMTVTGGTFRTWKVLRGKYNRCSLWPKLVSSIVSVKIMLNVNYQAELELIFNSTSSKEEEREKAVLDLRQTAKEYVDLQRREKSCGTEPPKL